MRLFSGDRSWRGTALYCAQGRAVPCCAIAHSKHLFLEKRFGCWFHLGQWDLLDHWCHIFFNLSHGQRMHWRCESTLHTYFPLRGLFKIGIFLFAEFFKQFSCQQPLDCHRPDLTFVPAFDSFPSHHVHFAKSNFHVNLQEWQRGLLPNLHAQCRPHYHLRFIRHLHAFHW